MFKLKPEKLIFGGQAIAHHEGQPIFLWNALPGEEVEAEIVKNKKDRIEAIARKIISPSKDRIEAVEEHFLSCSPWQILTPQAEDHWKKQISLETYQHIAKLDLKYIDIVSSEKQYGYRNKMEYSFAQNEDGSISLGFYNRGGYKPYPITECKLADPAINRAAFIILAWINKHSIPIRSLKTLVMRCNNKGQVIAGLFIKDRIQFADLPELNDEFMGFYVYLSSHLTPAARPDEILYGLGNDFLEADVKGVKLKYGLLSFFQINIPIFEQAIFDIEKFLDPEKRIIDFYAGVGTIGLSLSDKVKECLLIENNQEAAGWAEENIRINKLKHCQIKLLPAEKALDFINSQSTIVFDPPRPGLHKKIVEKILQEKPPRIIYLSCNISTQARDIEWLSSAYKVSFLKLYNFFPRTPHVEALCVLDLI